MNPQVLAAAPNVQPDIPRYHPLPTVVLPPGAPAAHTVLVDRYNGLALGVNNFLSAKSFIEVIKVPSIEGRVLRAHKQASVLRDLAAHQVTVVFDAGLIPPFPPHRLNKDVVHKLKLPPMIVMAGAQRLEAAATNAETTAQRSRDHANAVVGPAREEALQTAQTDREKAQTKRGLSDLAFQFGQMEKEAAEAAQEPGPDAEEAAANAHQLNQFFAGVIAVGPGGGYVRRRPDVPYELRQVKRRCTYTDAAKAGMRPPPRH